MTIEKYREMQHTVPTAPGVYRFISAKGDIIYVGKAKSLRSRLSSYFSERRDMLAKTKAMVKIAERFEYTIVNSEQDALLLECTLIKENQPRYNVMLKDGKTYPYFCIKNERFPRVFTTRQVVKDGSLYFGPYTALQQVYVIRDLIKQLFPLRTCPYALTAETIEKKKVKLCLEYHIKNCLGPCQGLETVESYDEKITQIKNILKGNFGSVKQYLKKEMSDYADNLEFEKAELVRQKLNALEDYQGKSTVVSTTISDVDVFSIATDEQFAYVNFLRVSNGAVISAYTQELTKNLDDEPENLLLFAILTLREKFGNRNKEIIVPFELVVPENDVVITVPKIGDKRKLLEVSEKNVQYFLLQKRKEQINKSNKQSSEERILRTLQKDLNMADLPMHIECFDNSNFHGSFPVSSCVVFKNAKPAKRDYRHFNVKTVEGPNDFATMEEVVYRRYKRLLAEDQSLPQLVIIDGGKGQLSAAMKSIKALGLEKQMAIVGIAKHLEEIFFPEDPIPLYIDKKSESLKLIQQARNEAHRFGITFHRNQRSKGFTITELTEIEGIGNATADKLLAHFKSMKQLSEAEIDKIEAVVGKSAAKKVFKFFSQK
ncbi:MAG: excinuclease ABC subunit UvrC [Saprospiraceae bacterium]